MSSDVLQVAALGQSFALGTLYDARRHNLVSGFRLWDGPSLQENTVENLQRSSAFHISASDSTQSKSSLLDVDASVKASFLGGLIEVGGSAKYLTDRKTFLHQSRVTFQYKATTIFKQLTVTGLSADEGLMERSSATHVVTGILYGADAFFVFDSQKLDASSVQEIRGGMEAVIKKIPTFSVEGKAQIQLTDQEKALVQKFSCKFYGDLNLPRNPTTFEEAVKAYVELPKLLGERGEKTVPVKVWLMPLKNLSPKAPSVLTELSLSLVRKLEEALEDVNLMATRCNDALVDGVAEAFPRIQQDLRRFQKLCSYYTSNLQKQVQKELPSIREDKEDESSLRRLLDGRAASPFSRENLLKWLEAKEREINVMGSCVGLVEGVKIVHNQSELDREVLRPGVQHTLCFVFTSLENRDPGLDAMAQYLDAPQCGSSNGVPWFYSDQVFTRIRGKARTFSQLANNLKNKSYGFLVAAINNHEHAGATIYHYKDAIKVTEDFTLKDVTAEETTDKEDLMWYTCQLSVDRDTLSNGLHLSEGNQKIQNGGGESYPENPRRFPRKQFMCVEALTRRSYWEVAWSASASEAVIVGVAYERIQRRDVKSVVGFNPDSFSLGQSLHPSSSTKLLAQHCGRRWERLRPPGCTRIAVFLDWPAGSLSFYMVSGNQLTPLYTFHHRFAFPLHPACYVGRPGNYVDLRQNQ